MRRSFLCALGLVAWLNASFAAEKAGSATRDGVQGGAGGDSAAGVTHQTTHYDVYMEGGDVGEVGTLLEAAHPQFTGFFGRSPIERLRFEIYASQEGYRAAVLRAGQGEETNGVEAAGCYLTSTKTVYMWPQQTGYLTRKTILHEAAHQFHFLTGTTNVRPRLKAYPEGLAEHFGLHTWNGKVLRMGVIPRIAITDYPAVALENFRSKLGRDFKGLMTGKRQGEYVDYWAAMQFLLSEHRQETASWMALLNENTATFAQTHPLIAWNSFFREVSGDMAGRFEEWLGRQQQGWRVVSGDWEDNGSELVGRSRSPKLSLAVLKETPGSLEVSMPELRAEESAGLILNYVGEGRFELLRLKAGRNLALIDATPGEWKLKEEWILPERATHLFSMKFEGVEGGEIIVKHEEEEIWRTARKGKAVPGIFVEEGDVRFVVRTEISNESSGGIRDVKR